MKGLLRTWVRRLSRWAWEPGITIGDEAIDANWGLRRYAQVRGVQLAMLEQLFIMKQEKITRLQQAYNQHKRPMMEDLRRENYIRNAEELAVSLNVMEERKRRIEERTGKVWKHSDGTVQGVPGDQGPDREADELW